MEQLVWAIIIIFIIFTALKNRARNRPDTTSGRAPDTDHEAKEERDKLARYMEELLGIETPETKPQVRVERKEPEPLEKEIPPKPEPVIEKKVGQFESPLAKKYEEKSKPPIPKRKDIYYTKFPWGTLSGKDLKNAIINAEILGPPISKRKSHRLY
ncbi:MAG: hypothetical protein MAG551_02384 [Candidatus Scalindua arabica]|uniref:Uncharacterized protein n=1 Tax=Candidatus Scalindua arabica TaxID=1127984 RepID=A0A941W7C8_9BACT|nr:hypothetical protein [Candidatus Scalindua arabica]